MADERKLSMSEVRKTISTSLGTAFGFVIALVWSNVVLGGLALTGAPMTAPTDAVGLVIGVVTARVLTIFTTVLISRVGRCGSTQAATTKPFKLATGKDLRSLAIREREIVHHANACEGPRVFGGPLARFRYYDEALVEPFDWVALRDIDTAVYDHLTTGEWTHRDRTMEEWDRWALLGADVVRSHPDFPDPLTVELDTSKGCVRYLNKGCSFCIEPMYGKPKFRPVAGVLREVRRLAELGAVNFRLGGQADFFSYQAIGLGSSATP